MGNLGDCRPATVVVVAGQPAGHAAGQVSAFDVVPNQDCYSHLAAVAADKRDSVEAISSAG